ncbi:hypothetical protein [Streptomyces eurythermus]|uniref:hypothetical protein n=1 Tax=Streptomyces eurythermus TaxID=42237 RepID=UPI003700E067
MELTAVLGDFGSALGTQAVGVAVSSVLTAGAAGLRWWVVKRLPARRTWRYTNAQSLVIVVAASAVIDTGTYRRPTTGIGQVRALAILAPTLTRAYRDVDLERIRISSQHLGHELESDLLILGGPKSNACAALMLDQLTTRLPFAIHNHTVSWGVNSYEGTIEDGVIKSDVGYIVRVKNPFSINHRVVMVGGSHTHGTIAAARWWVEHGGSRSIPQDVAVLVKANVLPGDHVAPPQVLHMAPVP